MIDPSAAAPATPSVPARLAAEAAGAFLLVFAVVGTAAFSAQFPAGASDNPLGVGFLGVALALGLSVMIGAFSFGPISGGHFNPAVSIGLAAARRFAWGDVPMYIVAQLVGAFAGSSAVFLLTHTAANSLARDAVDGGFVSNGYGMHSPGGFGVAGAAVVEVIVTGLFVCVILGVTHPRAAAGFAPIAIGLTLTVMLLVAIPVDNASLNPARSIATAIYGGGPWLAQVWVFVVFPIVGALIAGFGHRLLFETGEKPVGA